MLLSGEAGLRSGEMVALEGGDVNFVKQQLCIRRSSWKGQVGSPKNGRIRYVPLTVRLAGALRDHRLLRGPQVLYQDDGSPLTRRSSQRAAHGCGTRFVRTWRCWAPRHGRSRDCWDTRT